MTRYKNRYNIAFYSLNDEFLHMFNNAKDILQFQGKEITSTSINHINVMVYRALKRDRNVCRFLNGSKMKLYLIDLKEEE